MTQRAVELLSLPPRPCHVLDIGAGSGLSGEVLSEMGHSWVGVDISPAMLGVAVQREVEGDLICADVGHGLFFRPGAFDAAIRCSEVQLYITCHLQPLLFLLFHFNGAQSLLPALRCRCITAFLPCNGCATPTKRNTFLRSDFTNSSNRFMIVWFVVRGTCNDDMPRLSRYSLALLSCCATL